MDYSTFILSSCVKENHEEKEDYITISQEPRPEKKSR